MANDENDIAIRAVAMRERVTERQNPIKENSSIGAVFWMEMLEDARGMAVCGFRIWQYGYLHRQFFGSKQFTLAPYPLTFSTAQVRAMVTQPPSTLTRRSSADSWTMPLGWLMVGAAKTGVPDSSRDKVRRKTWMKCLTPAPARCFRHL